MTAKLQAVLSADQMRKFDALIEHQRGHRGSDDSHRTSDDAN